jgi:hypothetical protein
MSVLIFPSEWASVNRRPFNGRLCPFAITSPSQDADQDNSTVLDIATKKDMGLNPISLSTSADACPARQEIDHVAERRTVKGVFLVATGLDAPARAVARCDPNRSALAPSLEG